MPHGGRAKLSYTVTEKPNSALAKEFPACNELSSCLDMYSTSSEEDGSLASKRGSILTTLPNLLLQDYAPHRYGTVST